MVKSLEKLMFSACFFSLNTKGSRECTLRRSWILLSIISIKLSLVLTERGAPHRETARPPFAGSAGGAK